MLSEFYSISKKEWTDKIKADLKGKPLNSIFWELDGTEYPPYFHKEDWKDIGLLSSKESNDWLIGEVVICESDIQSNRQALIALNDGANALLFKINSYQQINIQILLGKIQLEWVSVHFDFKDNRDLEQFLIDFYQYIEDSNFDKKKINLSVNGDLSSLKSLTENLNNFPNSSYFSIPIKLEIDKPSTVLAKALYTGSKYLEEFENFGIPKEKWASLINFSVSLIDDFKVNIIQLRALKSLWLQIQKAWEFPILSEPKINVNIKDSFSAEPAQNMIRSCTQALSASISSVNSIFIYPSNYSTDPVSDKFSRRIALNINHILKEESHINKVIDPVSGSYFFDWMAYILSQKVWQTFQEMSEI